MTYFKTCPRCGASLDPGETCDCRDEENERKARIEAYVKRLAIVPVEDGEQLKLAV